jgi:hypothetical protein
MKYIVPLCAGVAALLLSSCSTAPKVNKNVNYSQAIESDVLETTIVMKTLNNLDSGEAAKARRVAMIPVFVSLDSFRYYTTQRLAAPTPEQTREWTEIAKVALDYMVKHRDEWDPKRVDLQEGLRGLRYLLTGPEEVRQLNELSQYLARNDQKAAVLPVAPVTLARQTQKQ